MKKARLLASKSRSLLAKIRWYYWYTSSTTSEEYSFCTFDSSISFQRHMPLFYRYNIARFTDIYILFGLANPAFGVDINIDTRSRSLRKLFIAP